MIGVPQFAAHGGHEWAEVFGVEGGVSKLLSYTCQRCGGTTAAYVVICNPGEEHWFTDRYGAENVQASPYVGLSPGDAYEIDGRLAHLQPCPAWAGEGR